MDINNNYRQLGASITLQAIRDFIEARHEPKKQAAIIKQLRSPYMELISDGLSPMLAEKLETRPREVCNRVKKFDREENLSHKSKKSSDGSFYADLLMEQQEQM